MTTPHYRLTRSTLRAISKCGPIAALVYLDLATYADQQGECWPSLATIAADVDANERTIRRALGDLVQAGLLTIHSDIGKPNRYSLTLDKNDTTPRTNSTGVPWTKSPDTPDKNDTTPRTNSTSHIEELEPRTKTKNKKSAFIPPTLEEVAEYCLERCNGIDAAHFVDFYESKGWRVGNQRMSDWRAAVRTWERRNGNGKTQSIYPELKPV